MNITEIPLNRLQTITGFDVLGIFAHQLHHKYGEADKYLIIYRDFNENLCEETVCYKGIKSRIFGKDIQFIIEKETKTLYVKSKSQLLNEGWLLKQNSDSIINGTSSIFLSITKDKLKFEIHSEIFGRALPCDYTVTLDFIKHMCVEK